MTSNYAEVHERARLCALALRRLGVEQGDRVATIAWNTARHLESWCSLLLLLLVHIILISPMVMRLSIHAQCYLSGAGKGLPFRSQVEHMSRE